MQVPPKTAAILLGKLAVKCFVAGLAASAVIALLIEQGKKQGAKP